MSTRHAAHPDGLASMARLLADPNPLHLDPAAAERLGLGGLVVQAPLLASWVAESIAGAAGDHGAVVELTLRFVVPVLAGETVEVETEAGCPTPDVKVRVAGVLVATGSARLEHRS
jgi:acyl dehydratase